MESVKEQILGLWNQVNRPGIDNLIKFLEESDFFTAPCSTKYHLAVPEGLSVHSYHVYNNLDLKVIQYGFNEPDHPLFVHHETRIICGLGHDFGKIKTYKEGGEICSEAQFNFLKSLMSDKKGVISPDSLAKLIAITCENGTVKRGISGDKATILIDWLKNKPSSPIPEMPITYSVDDSFPFGHGEKSVYLLQKFIPLTDVEALAIRWHMGMTEAGTHFNYPTGYAYQAASKIHPLVTLLFTADLEATNIIEIETEEK